ncbi:MAG TPA: serine hydrolase domain-containing protein, partial [Saprospiraceae bacterium]|nr:serine hydrolase domain-containing protein [Saprospiraceae bacterium]
MKADIADVTGADFHKDYYLASDMIRPLYLPIVLSISIFGCGRPRLDKPALNDLKIEYLDATQVDTIYQLTNQFPDQTQFAIALIKNGEVQYVGTKRIQDRLVAIQNHDKAFEIGSLTKVFTATVLAHFVLDGKVGLEATINPQFDFPFHHNLEFTYRALANHTSGLPRLPSNMILAALFNKKDPYRNYSEEKLDAYLKNDVTLDYEKGTKSAYSNLGMGLLSYALRKQSGRSFEELTKELIFDKYNMLHSTSDKAQVADILVAGLDARGRPTPNWTPGALIGAGGIYATVEDLAKFASAQFDSTQVALA